MPNDDKQFLYVDDFQSAEEEQHLLADLSLIDVQPLRMRGQLTERKIASFGLDYRPGTRHLGPAAPIPAFLRPVRDRAARIAGLQATGLLQALVTYYPAGAAIGWHEDHHDFGDTVVAVSLLGQASLEIRQGSARGPVVMKLQLARRSLYVLPPLYRYGHVHRVVAREDRYSITFRGVVGA